MIRILFLAANPVDQKQLRQGPEFTAIYNVLDGTRFALVPAFAATPTQLQDLLFAHKPQIVHFSGHGTAAGLYFEDANGLSTPVAPETLRDLFAHFADTVRCVVLNACYTQSQAAAIGTVIDAVVGMGDAVSDEAALAFAAAFYRGLSNNKSLAAAVDLGCNQIYLAQLAEADKPQLVAERIDPTQVRAHDWDVLDPTQPTAPAQSINTSGGSNIGGSVTAGGNVAGRDYIGEQHIHYHGEGASAMHPAQPTTPRGIFGLYPFNENFFGRDDELAALHRLLQTEPNVSICPTITGMGGLGKTQLAAHYARTHIADYRDGIFWITAADLNSIRPQLADFCVALNLPVADPQRTGDLIEQKISAFKAYLDGHPQALLIFDNVVEPDHLRTRQIGVGFTALTLGGKVLVTTRRRKLSSDRFAELSLERLLPEPARQILTTARPDLANDPDLDRLCAQFGYLPLMLNLAAAALKKRGGAIAGYLQKLQEWGIDTLHDRARVNLDDYHTSLTAVLQEQWAMLTSEDARLLLRVAGQLPEAEVIPTARLGLLAGLRDVDEWDCPLRDGLEELERASLIEMVDGETVRLHPLIRAFALALVGDAEGVVFRNDCAQRLADAYGNGIDGLKRLGAEYEQRGIGALLIDLITAIDLVQSFNDALDKSPLPCLQLLLRQLRLEAHHLHAPSERRQAAQLWQQLLLCTAQQPANKLTEQLLRSTLHWLPRWGHKNQSPAVELTLIGHEYPVHGVAQMADGRIVSASYDFTLKIWNLQTGQVELTLIGHKSPVNGVTQLADERLVSASDDCTLKVWNLQTGQVELTLIGHKGTVNGVAQLTDGRLVSTSYDRTLKVWNLQTGQVELTLIGHKDTVDGVAQLADGRLVSASRDETLKVWNTQTGQVEQTHIDDSNGGIRSVAVLDLARIVSASGDGTLKVWNLQTGQVEQILNQFSATVKSVVVLDRKRIVSASVDRTLKVWNLQSGEIEQTLTGHDASVNGLAVLDRERIVSASGDGTLMVWNLQMVQGSPEAVFQRVEQTLTGHDGSVNGVALLDRERIVSASGDGTLMVWNLQSGQVEQTLYHLGGSVNGVAVLDRERIVSASSDRTLKVWDLQSGQVEQILSQYNTWAINSVAVLDRERIVSASDDGTLMIWNLQSGRVERTLAQYGGILNGVAVLDASRIISASSDHTLKVWNLQSGQVEQTLTGHDSSVRDVSVVDANRIVSASADRTLKVWNLQSGQVIASIGLDGALTCVTVARQDGRTLVVAGDAGGALYCLELVEPVGQ